jgi:hypothetical protein
MESGHYYWHKKWKYAVCPHCLPRKEAKDFVFMTYARERSKRDEFMIECGDFVSCISCKEHIVEFGFYCWRPTLKLIQGGAA